MITLNMICGLLLSIMIVYSITTIIVDGSIFFNIKEFFLNKKMHQIYKLLNCPLCLSFWVGLFISIYLNINLPLLLFGDTLFIKYVGYFFMGCFYSGTSILLYSLRAKLYDY